MFKVYGKTNCPSCTSAKQLLETKGCEYEYLLFGKDYDLSKFVHINKNHKTMPMITILVKYDGVEMEEYIGGLVELKEVLATKYSKQLSKQIILKESELGCSLFIYLNIMLTRECYVKYSSH